MGAQGLPRELGDVTAPWITAMLHTRGVIERGEAVAAQVEQIAEGVGLMSQVGRVRLSWAPETWPPPPATMIVKLPAASESNRRMAEEYGLFERESRFYRELADVVGVATPRVYANEWDARTGSAVLLLEDVDDSGRSDPVGALDDDDVKTAVASIARMHAAWWEGSGSPLPAWVPALDGRVWSTHASLFDAAWKAFAAGPQAVAFGHLVEFGRSLAPVIPALQRRLSRRPVTLVHFDFRRSNLFVRRHPHDHVVVIDWQPLSVARGAYDLGYFVSQSLPIEQRRGLEKDLLALYHSTLVEHGVRDYGLDELTDDYRLSVGYTSSYAVGTMLIDLGNSTGRGYACETLRRAAAAVEDLDVTTLLRSEILVGGDSREMSRPAPPSRT